MKLRERARELRREPTDAEKRFWGRIRMDALGVRFRRQHPIGPFIADFACTELRLVIEVDGGQHATSGSDAVRTAWLEARGWQVVRYWNNQVLSETDAVVADLACRLAAIKSGLSD